MIRVFPCAYLSLLSLLGTLCVDCVLSDKWSQGCNQAVSGKGIRDCQNSRSCKNLWNGSKNHSENIQRNRTLFSLQTCRIDKIEIYHMIKRCNFLVSCNNHKLVTTLHIKTQAFFGIMDFKSKQSRWWVRDSRDHDPDYSSSSSSVIDPYTRLKLQKMYHFSFAEFKTARFDIDITVTGRTKNRWYLGTVVAWREVQSGARGIMGGSIHN